ncbi:DNA-binding domain-containing protein, AraC-type [Caulobacter sp. AP07]|uniref:AraC family transcriptional regulator n=1 Tax=Caulobacter sp. AP07 TaxID=1144304 RepID=UPI0002722066|nr:helix-turn-helix domain-containing protein [Caulobacter sp. AP07]EJL31291.1 DNA-binding domain-containing protein, AraC-type [Caulobacter sp. AP07]
MNQPVYLERAPRPSLARVVACVWSYARADGPDAVQQVVPDGCPELIVHLGPPHAERGADDVWSPQPTPLLAGQLTRPLHLRSRGAGRIVAVRFKPFGARRFAGQPMRPLTDRRVALAALHGAAAADALRTAVEAAADPLEAVQDYVEARLAAAPPLAAEDAVARAVERLLDEAGVATSAQLTAASGLPPRQLQRQFLDIIGVSPRTLRGVVRVRRVTDAVREGAVDLAEAALAAGYFDQAQMGRDFRRFVGAAPAAFLRGDPGLALSLALSETYKPTPHEGR